MYTVGVGDVELQPRESYEALVLLYHAVTRAVPWMLPFPSNS